MQNGVDDLGVLGQVHQLAHRGLRGATDELELLDLLFNVELGAVHASAGLGGKRA